MPAFSIRLYLLLLPLSLLASGTVESLYFATTSPPPACSVPLALKKNEQVFRLGLQSLPEGLLVMGALGIGRGPLGLSKEQGASLAPLLADAYGQIYKDAEFANADPALPYCFSLSQPTQGHYFMYRPGELPASPTCIVFLHGWGGNFQFYTWAMKQEFPNAIILAPSFGLSWSPGSASYLSHMLADAEQRLGLPLGRPWLLGISAGGRGGFGIYNGTCAEV
jgi:hypothetical protein